MMTDFNFDLIAGALTKVTILLAVVLGLALILRALEPRWRVLLVRGAIFAVPVILIADFLEPQLHLKARFQEQQLLWQNPVSTEVEAPAFELETAALPMVIAEPFAVEPVQQVPAKSSAIPASVWVLAIWLGVALILTLREFFQLRGVSRESKSWTEPSSRVLGEWRKICAEMGVRETRLQVARGLASPFLKPGFRSALVIPSALAESEQLHLLRHVFRHEAAHLKNHDAFWIPAVRILSCLVWFHPLAWCLAALHLKSCEEASDAEAARSGGTESYRGALAQLALDLVPVRAPAATFLRLPGVLSRLRAVRRHADRQPPKRWIATCVGFVLASAGAILGTVGFAQEDAKPTGPIADKLNSIVIPEIEFADTPLDQAFEFLRHKSRELDSEEPDPELKGINLLILVDAKAVDGISLKLQNTTLGDAVRYICEIAGLGARIDESALVITPGEAGIAIPISKSDGKIEAKLRKITVPMIEFDDTPLSDAIAFLRQKSVELDAEEPDPKLKGMNMLLRAGPAAAETEITLRLTNVPLVEALRYTAALARLEIRVDQNAVLFVPAEGGENQGIAPPPADARLEKKLKTIVIPKVDLNDTPLDQALEFLRAKSVELDVNEPDPGRKGVNLILRNGAAVAKTKITLRLTNVPLAEALRYVAELSQTQLSIQAHAVVISAKDEARDENPDLLYTKSYGVNFNAREKLKGADAKRVLEAAGVEFGIGASAIYNPSTSQLIIRNTKANLNATEAWLKQMERGGSSKVDKASPLSPRISGFRLTC
ncbi:MAG: hypothetical protein ACI8UO_006044 [Verrucomicrobiales bacterium]|jgi:hypothetical protein